jgi:hypothetical protein
MLKIIAATIALLASIGAAQAQLPVKLQTPIPNVRPGGISPALSGQDVNNANPLPTSAAGPTGFLQGVTVAGGGARVAQDPTQLFWDDFGTGTLNSAASGTLSFKWITPTTGGGGNATAANSAVGSTTLGSGTTALGWSILQTQKAFKPENPGWIYFQENNNFEFPVLLNAVRFWGFATFPSAPTAAAPYADAEGFELGLDGHLRAVTSASAGSLAAGTKLVINDLSVACPAALTTTGTVTSASATLNIAAGITVFPYEIVTGPSIPFGTTVTSVNGSAVTLSNNAIANNSGAYTFTGQCAPNLAGQVAQPQDAIVHAYYMYARGDRIFWAIDGTDNVVAQTYTGAPGPNVNTLPLGHIAVAGSTGPTSTATLNINAAVVGDTARNEINICDPTLPQNCASVTPTGALFMGGAYSYTHITTDATTVIKTTPGLLHTICINTPIATETITVGDSATTSTPTIAAITEVTAQTPTCQTYDVQTSTGLTVVTAVAAGDITVSWK